MPSGRQFATGVTRPGSFGFPVVTASAGRVAGNASFVPVSRTALLLAITLCSCLLLPSTSGGVATRVACLSILLFGLPHGALDLEIIKRERGPGSLGLSALILLYLGLAGAMAFVWQVAAVAALAIFLVVAIVHFADDWPELGSTFLAQGTAIALLTAPALLHLPELERAFIALSGRGEAAVLANLLLLLAPMSMAVASVAMGTLWRTGFRDEAIVGALSLVAMIVLPPVIGFACFFCLSHSPRHLRAALAQTANPDRARWVVPVVTLAAMGIAALLFAASPRVDLSASLVAASFMTLSLLTVPHMAVPVIVDAVTRRRSATRGRMLWTAAGDPGAPATFDHGKAFGG